MKITGNIRRFVICHVLCGVLVSRPVWAAWQVNARGECVSTWTAGSLLRGPKAIANVPLLPFRAGAGAGQHAPELWKSAPGPTGVVFVPGWVLLCAGTGLLESIVWAVGGVADTVTGGYLEIAPDQATELSAQPVPPFFMSDPQKPQTQDRCGRPLAR